MKESTGKLKISFKPEKFKESGEDIINPCRGWYQIHTFKIGEGFDGVAHEGAMNGSDTIALVLADISNYSDRELDTKAFDDFDCIFDLFGGQRIDMILRVVYDTVGECMIKEPTDYSIVKLHMEQVAKLVAKHSNEVFIYQGLLVGNWGEMHSSRHLTSSKLKELADIFLSNSGSSTYLSVRRPAYVRVLFPEGEDMRQKRVGIFDDAILGSDTHLGTFLAAGKERVKREHAWSYADELEYEGMLLERLPNGGEMLYPTDGDKSIKTADSLKSIADYFAKIHITYLNRVHDMKMINLISSYKWKKHDVYKGQNGYEYIGKHMGYRLVVRSASCVSAGTELRWRITIENVGFAAVLFPVGVVMTGSDRLGNPIEYDVTGWLDINSLKGGETRTYECLTEPIAGNVSIKAFRQSNGRILRFANRSGKGGLYADSVPIGSVKLKQI